MPRILHIQPRDSLIVRDGRPFSAFPGAKVKGYDFPPPQVIAGAVRARLGEALGLQTAAAWDDLLKKVRVRGPLLIDLQTGEPFLPAPLDALLFTTEENPEASCAKTEATHMLYRLSPRTPREEVLSDFQDLPEELHYFIEGPDDMPKSKPAQMPRFWKKEWFFEWLAGENACLPVKSLADLGIRSLPGDRRTHVKIDAPTFTAEESMLFETRGLEFRVGNNDERPLDGVLDLGLWLSLEIDGEISEELATKALTGVHPLGGERRLALWEVKDQRPPFLTPPQELIEAIQKTRAARIYLLTPAYFDPERAPAAYLPPPNAWGPVQIRAAAIGRAQTVSGWDLIKAKPKPSRRLVPAGSVYYVRFSDEATPKDIVQWVDNLWFSSLPGQPEQSQRDGFGLAAIGVWREPHGKN